VTKTRFIEPGLFGFYGIKQENKIFKMWINSRLNRVTKTRFIEPGLFGFYGIKQENKILKMWINSRLKQGYKNAVSIYTTERCKV